ncbi:YppF family protein [Anoxybacillus sp. J5B_2022]|uniref:YppF family protein n=1 Tax=Anoxybacillus sp. J5B_2022 TaxID=3003246 RepID=UPI0022865A4B|nr:YppF family protein [Anoxybacillus sp. J5B_2022]MCZ0754491.1 YppF family protein [Anoxybacillus sp. J5B_2022]
MNATELKNKFIATKNYEPTDLNELLDFARQLYLRGEITISQYRDITRELELAGAYKPEQKNEYVGL